MMRPAARRVVVVAPVAAVGRRVVGGASPPSSSAFVATTTTPPGSSNSSSSSSSTLSRRRRRRRTIVPTSSVRATGRCGAFGASLAATTAAEAAAAAKTTASTASAGGGLRSLSVVAPPPPPSATAEAATTKEARRNRSRRRGTARAEDGIRRPSSSAAVRSARPPSSSSAATAVRIGTVERPLGKPDDPKLVPVGYLPPFPSEDGSSSASLSSSFLSHLRWMMSKDSLGQDVLLVGPPGYGATYRRRLALSYAELTNREVEVVSLSSDVTESDLKQRRELVRKKTKKDAGGGGGGGGGGVGGGGVAHVEFVDQPPVKAAINGRLLILDGLEKAERNVLPALNNLLENREMNLDDGRFLVSSDRHRELLATAEEAKGGGGGGGPSSAGAKGADLVPTHPDFRVVALASPCPPYDGRSVDPPLRSRFQIRRVDGPTTREVYRDLIRSTSSSTSTLSAATREEKGAIDDDDKIAALLAKFSGAMESAAISSTNRDDGGGPGKGRVRHHPAGDALIAASAVLRSFPHENIRSVLARSYPLARDDDRIAKIVAGRGGAADASRSAFRRACDELRIGHGANVRSDVGSPYALKSVEKTGTDDPNAARVTFLGPPTTTPDATAPPSFFFGRAPPPPAATEREEVAIEVPCGDRELHRIPTSFVRTVGTESVLTAMLQEHSANRDVLLLGPRGEGKSKIASTFASLLGYDVRLFPLHRETTSRDLLLRRSTDRETGETVWEESPLVTAARNGQICVLDGIEKLGGGSSSSSDDALSSLRSLASHDREIALPDGRRLVRRDRWLRALADADDDDDGTLIPVHPSFRIVALGSFPSGSSSSSSHASSSFLSEELSSMFSTIILPPPTEECLRAILTSSVPSCPPRMLDSMLRFHETLTADAASDCGVSRLSTRDLVRLAKRAAASTSSKEEEEEVDDETKRLRDAIKSIVAADLLPPTQRSALESLLRKSKLSEGKSRNKKGTTSTPSSSSRRISYDETTVRIGSSFVMKRKTSVNRPELVPSPSFFDIPSHVDVIREALTEWKDGEERAFLLLGNQGVGKNKVVDRICQIANFEREYVQLHRDSTIGQLTLSPTLQNGKIVWKDSPLVRAASFGRCLVVDEADKAPSEVVGVLKGLVEDGELLLADGRRMSRDAAEDGNDGDDDVVRIHPDFTVWILANRPGHPFHGNDFFREIGDCVSTKVLPNPPLDSEIELLRSYGPSVDESTLRAIASSFDELRDLSDRGDLSYPYSTREAVSVAKHLERYPEDGLGSTLRNVLDMDSFDGRSYGRIAEVFRRHGVPVTYRPSPSGEGPAEGGGGEGGERLGIEYVHGDGRRRRRGEAEGTSEKPPALGLPKVGRWDDANEAHVGGNQWAGGTGGSDTAGLGGRGGPYRLDRGHKVHQVSDEAKAEVAEEAAAAAREMARKALEERLAEIGMSEREWNAYDEFVDPIRNDVANLRGMLRSVESKRSERDWIKRQSHGEIDESRLVDGVAGDRNIHKRRGVVDHVGSRPARRPKRLRFVMDCSGSMYRFNGYDERLNRSLEAAALVMESFDGMEDRFEYGIVGHSGDAVRVPLVPFGKPPANAKERMRVLQTMVAHAQYCRSGDHTLEAMEQAIVDVAEGDGGGGGGDRGPGDDADECIVVGISDANLRRYGIHPRELGRVMTADPGRGRAAVKSYCIFIASFGDEAEDIKRHLPLGRGFVCFDTSELPRVVRNILASQVE